MQLWSNVGNTHFILLPVFVLTALIKLIVCIILSNFGSRYCFCMKYSKIGTSDPILGRIASV